MTAVIDFDTCPPGLVDDEQIARLRQRVYSTRETEKTEHLAHLVEEHWDELPLDAREKLRDFVGGFDEWAKHYRPRSAAEIWRAICAAITGDNLRFSVAVARIISAVRRHVRLQDERAKQLADRLAADPEIERQIELSQAQFRDGEFVSLSAEQIRARTW